MIIDLSGPEKELVDDNGFGFKLFIIGYSYIENFGEMNENAFRNQKNIQILNERRWTSVP